MNKETLQLIDALRMCVDAIAVYGPEHMHGLHRRQYIKAAEKALANFPAASTPGTLRVFSLKEVMDNERRPT